MIATQGRRVCADAQECRAGRRVQSDGTVGMAINMAVQTGHAADWLFSQAMFGLIEPSSWEPGDEQSQPFHLFGSKNAVEQFVEVGLGDFPAARDVAKVRSSGQKQGRGKLGQISFG